jgi:hypothetical protein
MSNISQTLRDGLGKPIFIVTDKVNNEILIEDSFDSETLSPLSNYIKSLDYTYDEENDDECVISIAFNKVSQLDNTIFQENNILKVQWGYITPGNIRILSPTRTIAIRDIAPNYTNKGISLVLRCTDLVSYLRRSRLNTKSDSNNFVDWLKEIAADEFTAAIRLKNRSLVINKDIERDYEISEKGQIFARDNARSYRELFVKLPDLLMGGKSKSIYAEIQERLNSSAKDPAYIDGRDGNINIVFRNWDQKPWVSYTLGGGNGEIISFRAKSNMEKVKEDGAQTSTVNPETKEIESTEINTISTDPDGTEPTPKELQSMYLQFKKNWEHNILNPTDMKPLEGFTYKRRIDLGPFASPSNIDGNTKVYTGLKPDIKIKIAAKTILNMPGFIKEQKEGIARNYMERKIQRKFEANISVIGDPTLVTSKIYEFLGLSKRDSGSWYAVKVEHSISTSRGYICNITALRKPKLLAIQYLKRKTKIISVEDKIKQKVSKEVTNEKKYSEPIETSVEDTKSKKLNNDRLISSAFDQELDRLEILKAEDTFINSPGNLSQEVNTSQSINKPNIEDV